MRKTQVIIEDLEVAAHVGVTDAERASSQPLLVSVSMAIGVDDAVLVQEDSIEGTMNYSTIAREIRECFAEARFRLIETAAIRISEVCLRHRAVEAVEVTVKKPRAIQGAKYAAVSVSRAR